VEPFEYFTFNITFGERSHMSDVTAGRLLAKRRHVVIEPFK